MTTNYGFEGNEIVETKTVNGIKVKIIGCFYKDTTEGTFDFYDLYIDDQCINEGEPCYEYPTEDDIEAFLELQQELNKE